MSSFGKQIFCVMEMLGLDEDDCDRLAEFAVGEIADSLTEAESMFRLPTGERRGIFAEFKRRYFYRDFIPLDYHRSWISYLLDRKIPPELFVSILLAFPPRMMRFCAEVTRDSILPYASNVEEATGFSPLQIKVASGVIPPYGGEVFESTLPEQMLKNPIHYLDERPVIVDATWEVESKVLKIVDFCSKKIAESIIKCNEYTLKRPHDVSMSLSWLCVAFAFKKDEGFRVIVRVNRQVGVVLRDLICTLSMILKHKETMKIYELIINHFGHEDE